MKLLKNSINAKLIVAFLMVALLPMGIVTFLNARATREALVNDANQILFAVAQETANSFDNFNRFNLDGIETEAKLPDLTNYLATPANARPGSPVERNAYQLLQILAEKDPYITSYGLLDENGVVVLDVQSSEIGMDKSSRPYVSYFMDNTEAKRYVSPVIFSPVSGEPSIYFSSPVLVGDKRVGVLRVRFHADVLQNILEDKNDLAGAGSFGVLFDEYHLHLAHSKEPSVNFIPITHLDEETERVLNDAYRLPDLPDEKLYIMQLDDLEYHLTNYEADRFFEAEDVATGELINQVALARMETQPWLVAFFQPQEIFLAPQRRLSQTTFWVVTVLGLITVAAAVLFGRSIGGPIVALTETVNRFKLGDLSARAEVNSQDEIGLLSDNFNRMARRVGLLVTDLQRQTTIIETTSDFITLINLQNEVEYINKPGLKLIGREEEDYHSIKIADFRPEETVATILGEIFPTVLKEGRWTGEMPLMRADGSQIPTSNVIALIKDDQGNPIGIGTIARDISTSKTYEAQLEEQNEELDAFAGIVAHDLRTPLTPILGAAQLIKTFYGETIDERGHDLLDKIGRNAEKMGDIITALLTLTRLRHEQPAIEPLDMGGIVKEVLDRLEHMSDERDAVIELPKEWPVALGQRSWIEEVWANYISNAIKYGGTPPVISFETELLENGLMRFGVRDNGAGIAEEHHDSLFAPFTRLETGEIEGHGLGLSIVKRIVHKLGGEVGVVSEIGKGSLFWFSLPLTEKEN